MEDQDFKLFYETHAKPLWAYVYRLTNDSASTEDIVQESFIRLLNRDLKLFTDAQKKSYLYQTATNLFRDSLRKRKHTITWENLNEYEAPRAVPQDDGIDFDKAFERLTPQHRALLWMAYAEGYSHEEIATTLDLKTSSVKVLLFRAKKKMTDILNELGLTGEV